MPRCGIVVTRSAGNAFGTFVCCSFHAVCGHSSQNICDSRNARSFGTSAVLLAVVELFTFDASLSDGEGHEHRHPDSAFQAASLQDALSRSRILLRTGAHDRVMCDGGYSRTQQWAAVGDLVIKTIELELL